LQSVLLGRHRWVTSLIFEEAATCINLLLLQLLGALVGVNYTISWPGRVSLVLYSSPVLLWGIVQVGDLLKDIRHHIHVWHGGKAGPHPAAEDLRCAVQSMSAFTNVRPPMVRVETSEAIYAYAGISPLPFLPRTIVLSQGALDVLPARCVRALLAHEIGHIKRGHTRTYTLLRLLSRLLLLGPSFLTGLIKPPDVLETEADSFAVQWLEAHGGSREDLVDALKTIEQQKLFYLLPRGLRESIAFQGGAETDWLPANLRHAIINEPDKGYLRRLANGWRLWHYMTMHSDLATYTYLPFAERLRLIAALPHKR
jgi:hypothetical protein